MGSHSVTCHPAAVTFPPLPQLKLVLDLATQEGCKAELTWVVVISWIVYPHFGVAGVILSLFQGHLPGGATDTRRGRALLM